MMQLAALAFLVVSWVVPAQADSKVQCTFKAHGQTVSRVAAFIGADGRPAHDRLELVVAGSRAVFEWDFTDILLELTDGQGNRQMEIRNWTGPWEQGFNLYSATGLDLQCWVGFAHPEESLQWMLYKRRWMSVRLNRDLIGIYKELADLPPQVPEEESRVVDALCLMLGEYSQGEARNLSIGIGGIVALRDAQRFYPQIGRFDVAWSDAYIGLRFFCTDGGDPRIAVPYRDRPALSRRLGELTALLTEMEQYFGI